jgi:hypothetical protein
MCIQITETFEVSYFDRDHQRIDMKRDNIFNDELNDTGVKINAFFVLNDEKYSDRVYGKITVKTNEGKEESFDLRCNSLLLIKSRLVSYKV